MARINITFGFVVVATVLLLACASARPIEVEAGPKEPACVSNMKKLATAKVCALKGITYVMNCQDFCWAINDITEGCQDLCRIAKLCTSDPKDPDSKLCKNCQQSATRMSQWYCNVPVVGVEEEGQEVAP